MKHRALWPRFRDAFAGLVQAYREEPNLRFHAFAATAVAVTAYATDVADWEVAYLALTIMAVLFAEMVNTAVERAVDLAAGGLRHPLAAQAKEVAAGAVLLSASHAAFAAIYLFAWRRNLSETVSALLGLLQEHPWVALLPILAGLLGLISGGYGRQSVR
jgi:diacylglycerol kinase